MDGDAIGASQQTMMTTAGPTKLFEILVVGGGSFVDDAERQLETGAHVEHASSLDAAFAAISSRKLDLLIVGADVLPTFQQAGLASPALAVLDSLDQGVCIARPVGEMNWANAKFHGLSAEVRDRVGRFCLETALAQTDASGTISCRAGRTRITAGACESFEVTATPIYDLQKRLTRVAAVVTDVTSADRLQDKIDAIDQAGRDLLSLDTEQFSRLEMQERLALLEQKIFRCTRDLLKFDNFEIRVLDLNSTRLDLVLSSGVPADGVHAEICASAEGSGISGYVASRGRSYICADVSKDPRYLPGIQGAKSSLTVPLFLNDKVIGIGNFESTMLAAFSEDDRQLAEVFGRYISLSLHILKLMVSERQVTTGQLGRNVMAEITAPVNDILTDIESLVEDYIGHDDLRHRLRTISENAVRVRETIKDLVQPKPGVICSRSTPNRRRDPLLEGRRILLADDEDVIRETIRDVLTGYGCEVDTASDGAAAMDLILQKPFDLVLSDIKMPIKSGYEVFAAAKAANSATPVILTTGFGYDPNHCIVRARREGLSAVLFKPFKVDQLLLEIRSALKGAQA